jgi:hypothetical protein
MIQIKERKEMEDSFKKAQKPWAKMLAKVNKTKVDYHTACKTEKSASNQERNAAGDSSLSPDQVCMSSQLESVAFSLITLFLIYLKSNCIHVKNNEHHVELLQYIVGHCNRFISSLQTDTEIYLYLKVVLSYTCYMCNASC